MGYSLGVDLGTTFVAAALAVDGRAEMFTLGDRSEVTPSAVYLQEDGTLVTGEAAASLRTVSSADRVAREFKRRLGDPTPVVLAGRSFAATELLGAQLRDVLARVIESEGEPPENVVLTHPANWGPFRRTLFDGVLRFGGLSSAHKVTEPEAAATRYAATRKLEEGQLVAVYDLGGGTFDATILRKTADGMEIVGIPEGIERLGGIDFDEAILRYVNYTTDNALNALDMRDARTTAALARLRQDCILAKEALSADTETVLPVFLPDRHFDVKLDRATFEDLIRAHVESTIGALARTLDSAQVRPEDLSSVLLIGGSSRIPLISEMVSSELGRPIAVDTHPKYAVALGAATLAGQAPSRRSVLTSASASQAPPPQAAPTPASTAAPVPVGATPVPALAPTEVPPQTYQAPPAAPSAMPPTAPDRSAAAAATAYQPPAPAYQPPAPSQPIYQPQPPAPQQSAPQPVAPSVSAPQQSAPQQSAPQQQYQQPGYQQPGQPGYQQPGYQQPSYPGGYQQQPQQWYGQPPRGRPAESGRGKQRALLATIVVALLIAAGAAAFVMLKPGSFLADSSPGTSATNSPAAASGTPVGPTLKLSTDAVAIGDTYYITASGFTPGENVTISWTGPTKGTMGSVPADQTGTRVQGPILEQDPPGNYVIIATGQRSGRTVEASLQVLPEE